MNPEQHEETEAIDPVDTTVIPQSKEDTTQAAILKILSILEKAEKETKKEPDVTVVDTVATVFDNPATSVVEVLIPTQPITKQINWI